MVGHPLRAIVKVSLLFGVLWGVGQVLSRRLEEGDAESDEFSIAAIFGGRARARSAASLRHGRVIACCGGVDLDLRAATLAPDGAELLVQALMGGVQVTVPAGWRVTVDADTIAGGVDTNLTPREELPDEAPSLQISVVARMGGVAVTTAPLHEAFGPTTADGALAVS